jgi:hypothetical protein
MVATELRVGNLINHGDKTIVVEDICKVGVNAEIDSYGHCDQIYYILWKDLNPIPLTHEWLIKLGFHDNDYKTGYIGIDVCHTDFVLTKPENEDASHAGFYRWVYIQGKVHLLKRIQYVHDLQNLFYAITGEELKLKNNEKVDSV